MSKRKEKPAAKQKAAARGIKIPRKLQIFIILSVVVSLLFVGFGGYLRLFGAGSSAASGGGGTSQPVHSGSNEQNVEPARYSEGLEFTSNGDGTCSVSGIGTCIDTDLIIPSVSPDGDSVTSIGLRAFGDCKFLTSAFIPDSVASIETIAFCDCDGLTSVIIGNGVSSIQSNAFNYCESLISFTILAKTPPTIFGYHFFNGSDNCLFYVPSVSLEEYKVAAGWSDLSDRIFPLESGGVV